MSKLSEQEIMSEHIRDSKAQALAKELFPQFIDYLMTTRKYDITFTITEDRDEKKTIHLNINDYQYKGTLEYRISIATSDPEHPDHIRKVTIDQAAIFNTTSTKKMILLQVNTMRLDDYTRIRL